MLLAPDMREWVRPDHLVHFVLDAVEALDLSQVKVNARGAGDAQYPPSMLLALLVYSYATGLFGSGRIEQSTYDNVAVRVLTADTHPDHDTICTFRRENKALFAESFVKVLPLAQELKLARFGQIAVSVDGTKLAANASKHAAVSRLIVGERVSQSPNDKEELVPSVAAIASQTGPLAAVLADSGFSSEAAVKSIEQNQDGSPTGTVVYTAMERSSHHRSVAELEKKPEPPALPPEAGMGEKMRHRLKTPAGQALYKLRQSRRSGIEPVFGIIKSAMGFRPFLLRGVQKVSTEWTLVCLAYNLRRLHTLEAAAKLAAAA
jgi:transposase